MARCLEMSSQALHWGVSSLYECSPTRFRGFGEMSELQHLGKYPLLTTIRRDMFCQ